MRKILVLFAHPKFEHSIINKKLINTVEALPQVTVNDLYEEYPDFNIDVTREKDLLVQHDVIVWHYPMYWYSCPPLMKQWLDLVLEFGWAYGSTGDALKGKYIFNAVSTGGAAEAYQRSGKNRFALKELLAPFEQTAYLCKMRYLPYFAIQGTHRIEDATMGELATTYSHLMEFLGNPSNDPAELGQLESLNHFNKITYGQ